MKRKIINSQIDFFLISLTSISAIIIYLSRIGLNNDIWIILKSISLSYFIILFPSFFLRYFFKNKDEFFVFKPIFSFIIILLIILSGIIKNIAGLNMFYAYFIFGFFLFFSYILSKLSNLKITKQFLFILFFSIIFSIFITSVYYSSHYVHPLMIEKIINGSWPHRDTLYHASIAGMFKTYLFTGTGLDGFVPHHYHSLSHSIFGMMSLLIDINTLDFYSIVYPIIITPIFFMFLLFSILEISKFFSKVNKFKIIDENSIILWFAIYIFFALPINKNYLPEKYQYIQSQSYALALIILFLIIYLIFININTQSLFNNLKYNKFSSYFFSLIIFLLSVCASYSKVSFLYVSTILGLYLLIRFKLYKQFYYLLLLLLWISFLIFLNFDLLSMFDGRDIHLTQTYSIDEVYNYHYSLKEEFFFSYLSILFIILKLISLRIFSFKSFIYNFKNKKILDIEFLFLLIIALYFVPFQYFKGIQLYISCILIIAHLNLFRGFIFK